MIAEFLREVGDWGTGFADLLKDQLRDLPIAGEIIKIIDRPKGRPIIQGASSTMYEKESFQKCFKPNVYAFGPIRHRDPHLRGGQRMKVKLAGYFLKHFFEPTKLLKLYFDLESKILDIKKWYDETEIDKHALSLESIFFMDGCSLLCYMYLSSQNPAAFCHLGIENSDDDLFLLENQIPYSLLELIINELSSDNMNIIRKSIDVFVNSHCTKLGFNFQGKSQIVEKQEQVPYHLLDLLWMKAGCIDHHRATASRSNPPPHPQPRPQPQPKPQPQPQPQLRRYSVQKLKELRVQMMPKNIWLRDMSFEMAGFLSRVLKIHPVVVEHSTIKKVVNLIAYELSPDIPNDRVFISYLHFLGSHIATVEDVSELRSANVLLHSLPSDEFVLELFREVATNLEPNPKVYADVEKKIEEYCDSPMKSTMATWLSYAGTEYCKNPWTVMAVLAAALALLLTAVQTYYAAFPRGDDSGKKSVHHIRKFLLN